jgi:hypothetical protein
LRGLAWYKIPRRGAIVHAIARRPIAAAATAFAPRGPSNISWPHFSTASARAHRIGPRPFCIRTRAATPRGTQTLASRGTKALVPRDTSPPTGEPTRPAAVAAPASGLCIRRLGCIGASLAAAAAAREKHG